MKNPKMLKFVPDNLETKPSVTVKVLPASIKSMNPMQKYPHIIKLFACTQKMLAFMFVFPINSLISSGTYSTPKLLKQTISLLLQNKAIQCVPISAYSSRFITYALSFIFLSKLFLE